MQHKIFSDNSSPRYFIIQECGGTLSLGDVVDMIQQTDDYEEYHMRDGDIFGYNDLFDNYGPSTIINSILTNSYDKYDLNDFPDPLDYLAEYDDLGIVVAIDLDNYYTDQEGYNDGDKNQGDDHFFHYAYGFEKGFWDYEKFETDDEFNPQILKPIFCEKSKQGVISHYHYENKSSGESIEIYGQLIESRAAVGGAAYLFANTPNGLKQVDF